MTSVADLTAREAALGEMRRLERMRAAWQAYYGDSPAPLPVRPGAPDDNVRLNFARLIVDKGVSFLFGRGVGFELDGEARRSAAEAWLDRVWQANRKDTLLHRVAVNGGVCGHAWVRVRAGAAPGEPPRLLAVDPQTVSVRCAPDDWETPVEYRIEWHGVDPRDGGAVAFRQAIARAEGRGWSVVDQVSEGDRREWRTTRAERWPHDWPPLVGCQNLPAPNELWGMGDLEGDLLEVLAALSQAVSNVNRILRLHAHPRIWTAGFTPGPDFRTAPDAVTHMPAGATMQSLEMRTDLSSSLAFIASLQEAWHELARVPAVATGRLADIGRLSGVALQILYQPLLEKTETKRMLYGDLLAELNRRLLEMGGFGGDRRTALRWPDMVPADPRAEAEAALRHRELGVSEATLMERLGFDPGLEASKRAGTAPEGAGRR
ncbi:MAG: phage portal protein [Chthonomonadales bacterium]|nr:phage portal protein [Chthonomonadales bacterium]